MFNGSNVNAEQNRSIVALMVEMAQADAFSAPIERDYIIKVAENLGISRLDVEDMENDPRMLNFSPPSDEQERMTILYYLLFTMRADGHISVPEENYLYDISLRLGMNPAMIGDLLNVVKRYVNKTIPPMAMLSQIKKYLN